MGAYSSTHLTPEEIEELEDKTNFTSKEISQLYHRFKKLDRSRTGMISRMDFQLISELVREGRERRRILSLFQTADGESALTTGGVTFDCFVKTLDFFNERTPVAEKLGALFRAYDCDADGVVSERDLRAVLRLYVGPHLSDAALRVMCRNTMQHALEQCGAQEELAQQPEKQERAAHSAHTRKNNNNNNHAAIVGDDSPHGVEECHQGAVRGLNLQQFSQVLGPEALAAMNVVIPLRSD